MRQLEWREIPYEAVHASWCLVDAYSQIRVLPAVEVSVTTRIYYDIIKKQLIKHEHMLNKTIMEVADLPNAINK